MRRPTSVALVVLAALPLAACGRQGSEPQQVREAVERFAQASKDKDYQEICDDTLSRRLVREVEGAGLPCETAWQKGLGAAQAPSLTIRTIAVNEDRALVGVRSAAANQKPSDDVLELVREDGDWRIVSLARPQPQAPARP